MSRSSRVAFTFLPFSAFGVILTAETQVGVTTNTPPVTQQKWFHQGWQQMRVTAGNLALENMVLVVFLSALKIGALSNLFWFLLSLN